MIVACHVPSLLRYVYIHVSLSNIKMSCSTLTGSYLKDQLQTVITQIEKLMFEWSILTASSHAKCCTKIASNVHTLVLKGIKYPGLGSTEGFYSFVISKASLG